MLEAVPPQPATPPPSAADQAQISAAHRIVERELTAFNGHNLDDVARAFAPDARLITGHRGPPITGPDGVRYYVVDQYAQFPGLALDPRTLHCETTPPSASAASPNAADVRCDVRWYAHWHDRDTGRLLGRDGGASFLVQDGLIVEVRLGAHALGADHASER